MADVNKYLGQLAMPQLVAEIKAQDAKILEAAKKHCDDKDKLFDAAGAAATAEQNAKKYTDDKIAPLATTEALNAVDGKVTAEKERAMAEEARIVGLVEATDAVADKAAEDIAALTQTHATDKASLDAKDVELAEAIAGVDSKIGEVAEGQTVMGIIQNIQDNAYDDTELRGLITGLDTNKADKTQVATDIAAAVKVETDARTEAVAGVQSAVDTLSQTHTTDKTALEGAIALKADQTALDAVSAVANAAVKQSDYDTKVAALEAEDARIAGLVTAEAERAAGVESGLNERLEEVEAFFKLAEGEQLDEALDTLKELQVYVTTEGAAADQMVLDIAANKKSIEDHVATDHDFATADATLKAELEGKINAKAAQADLEALDGRVEDAEGKITEIEGKLADIEDSADANVIETVKVNGVALTPDENKAVDVLVPTGALASKDEVAEEDLAEALATKLNAKAEAQALTDAVATLTEADDAIKGRLDELEKVDHDHANKAELDLIATGDKAKWDEAAGKAHEHANKAELDKFVDGDKAKLDDVYTKAHVHENADVIAGITSENITTWNTVTSKAAQTDLDGAITRIGNLETGIATKAEQEDLDDAVERIATAEAGIADNKARLDAMVEYTAAEITAMFA